MSLISNTTRRAFMAAQAAVAGLVALPKAARARTEAPLATTDGACDAEQTCLPARWDTATEQELRRFIGDRFRVRTAEHGTLAMRLTALEPVTSGPDRPAGLRRRSGVIAVFESPDIAPIVSAGHQTVRVSHPQIGTADLFVGPSPKRRGGHVIEMVLN